MCRVEFMAYFDILVGLGRKTITKFERKSPVQTETAPIRGLHLSITNQTWKWPLLRNFSAKFW